MHDHIPIVKSRRGNGLRSKAAKERKRLATEHHRSRKHQKITHHEEDQL